MNKVEKSNALVEAGYRLTLTEMQVVLYGISLINPIKNEFPLRYRIDINKFAQLFNREHADIYHEIKNAVLKRFWERDFSYKNEKGKIVTNRWLTQIVHDDGSGFIELKFNEEIQPYLHQLKTNFTTYYIDKISSFKSIYSVRFYEYAIMHLGQSKLSKCMFSMTIDEIKNRLELQDRYHRFCDFKARVIEPAKKEINAFSDLDISYEVRKNGKTPYEISFTAKKKRTVSKNIGEPKNKILSLSALEKAKKMILKSSLSLDIYEIEEQFRGFMEIKGLPKDINAAFIGFVKSKIQKLS